MGQGKKKNGKSGKARETARREEPETARAGEADEPSTSQEPGEDPFFQVNSGWGRRHSDPETLKAVHKSTG